LKQRVERSTINFWIKQNFWGI